MEEDKIKVGHYIIIQRQKYTKLFKFNNLNSQASLGKETVLLKDINGHSYSSTFKMIPTKFQGKKVMDLEPCSDISSLKKQLNITESGTDNRNLSMGSDSQTLNQDDIAKLRESGSSASEIVGTMIENSKTFATKTEYSQDKYLRKKEKKYFEFLQIRRPTIRLLAEIMYRQDPEKILGLRFDSISQIISYSNVSATGNFLLYESGTNGLVPAVLLNSIGSNTQGKLLHLFPGNSPQRQALLSLNMENEQLDRCISVNIYSILRHYYQKSGGNKRKLDEISEVSSDPPAKVSKTDEVDKAVVEAPKNESEEENKESVSSGNGSEIKNDDEKTPKWVLDNECGCELLRENLDALVMVAKEHPVSILNALLPFVKPSRPVVIFSLSRDILMEAFIHLKSTGKVTDLKLSSNWLRNYQILPNRTHPDVIMNGNSGFILHGYTIR